MKLVEKSENLINRKIRYLIYNEKEFAQNDMDKLNPERLLLWYRYGFRFLC